MCQELDFVGKCVQLKMVLEPVNINTIELL